MSVRRLALLQWLALLAGAGVWAGQHVVGFGITQAACGAGLGVANDTWQAALLAAAAALILAAEAAALAVLVRTRASTYEAPAPEGRIRFFAIAAAVANALFLVIVVLDGVASIVDAACRQG
jgi:hypothetical protein